MTKKQSIIILGFIISTLVIILAFFGHKVTNINQADVVPSQDNQKGIVEPRNVQVGDSVFVNNQQYLIIKIMNSADNKTQMRLLVDHNATNERIVQSEHFLKSLRCFEAAPKHLGEYYRPAYVSLWNQTDDEMMNFDADLSVEQLAGANTCLEIVRVLSDNELLVLLSAGDGMGNAQQLYHYQINPGKLTSLYGFRLFAQPVDGDIDTQVVYHGWVKDDVALVQVEGMDQVYSPVYRVEDEEVSQLFYTFEDLILDQPALLTDQKVEADLIKNFDLDYNSGVQFQVGDKEVRVPWD